ncbi:MAG: hypothetical protein WDN04_28305 [Rhodospirillales bacterium]
MGFGFGLLLTVAGGLAHGAWYRAWPGRVLGGIEVLLYATPGFVVGTVLVLVFFRVAGVAASGGHCRFAD